MNTLRLYTFLLSLILLGCNNAGEKKHSKTRPTDGVVKQYRTDGSVKTEITYKNGKKNGLAKSYYKNGKLRQEINYVNNVKHGKAITYYQSGNKYQITEYDNNKISGIQKKYRMDGRLTTEAPYSNGKPCAGLKEYLTDGRPKTIYPKIVIREIDHILKNNIYILRLSISDHSRTVTYYMGNLEKDGCIAADAMKIDPQKPGILDLKYNIPAGTFIMKELNFIAVVKTRLGNSYITTKKYNLAIENRG